MRRGLFWLLAVALASCDQGTATEISVRFAVDPVLTPTVASLHVRAFDAEGVMRYDETREVTGSPTLVLPATVPFVPIDGDAGRALVVEGELLDVDGVLLGRQRAETRYVAGEHREIWLCFRARCVDVTCEGSTRCVDGECVPAALEARPLGEVDGPAMCGGPRPSTDGGPRDAGPTPRDGGSPLDGGGADGGPGCTCECASDECVDGACRPAVHVTGVTLGGEHACAVVQTGEVSCWGANGSGQLGLGDITNRSSPTLVPGSAAIASLSAGSAHTCALDTSGAMFCWGDNAQGQMDIDDRTVDVLEPTPMEIARRWSQMSAGGAHTCAVETSGALRCIGDNRHGQLGLDQPWTSATFWGLVDGTWTAVAAGASHTCAIRTSDRHVLCWGQYNEGRLGEGTTALTMDQRAPMSSPDGNAYRVLALGDAHSCAIETDGTLRCWGNNRLGAIGIGTGWDTPRFRVIVREGEVLAWQTLDAGGGHTCATEGTDPSALTLQCWGENSYGQIGIGTLTPAVYDPATVAVGPWTAIALGRESSCALRMDGTLWCWGRNSAGQLGMGDMTDRSTPTRVCF